MIGIVPEMRGSADMGTGGQGEHLTKTKPANTEQGNTPATGDPGAWRLLQAGIQAVPAVKYAEAVAAIMAALSLGRALFTTTRMAVLGFLAMLALMVLLRLFAVLANVGPKFLRFPALVFTWTILALFVVSASLSLTTVFFDWPRPFVQFSAMIFGRPPDATETIANIISGTVYQESGEILEGVTVTILPPDRGTTETDSSGTFTLRADTRVEVKFSKTKYVTRTYPITPGGKATIILYRDSK